MMLTKKEPETFTYEEAAAYIEEIPKFTKKHMLEHTKTSLTGTKLVIALLHRTPTGQRS